MLEIDLEECGIMLFSCILIYFENAFSVLKSLIEKFIAFETVTVQFPVFLVIAKVRERLILLSRVLCCDIQNWLKDNDQDLGNKWDVWVFPAIKFNVVS